MAEKVKRTAGGMVAPAIVGWSPTGRVVHLAASSPASVRGSRRHEAAAEHVAAVAVEVVLADDATDLSAEPAPGGSRKARERDADAAVGGDVQRRVADAAAAVTESLEVGSAVRRLAAEMRVDAAALVDAIAQALQDSRSPVAAPAAVLSAGEAAALERAGSLASMPAVPARASVRSAARSAALATSALTVRDVAAMLQRSEVRIRQRLAEHTLLGLRSGGAWRVPAFQFDDGGELPGWDRVMAAFPADVHPLTVAHFLDTPHPDLDVAGEPASPREWLRDGANPGRVVELAGGLHTLP